MSRVHRKWSGWPWWVVGRGFEAALEARGYTVLLSVGFGEKPDGSYSLKVAASPVLKTVSEENWMVILETLVGALLKMRATPMDDLEIE